MVLGTRVKPAQFSFSVCCLNKSVWTRTLRWTGSKQHTLSFIFKSYFSLDNCSWKNGGSFSDLNLPSLGIRCNQWISSSPLSGWAESYSVDLRPFYSCCDDLCSLLDRFPPQFMLWPFEFFCRTILELTYEKHYVMYTSMASKKDQKFPGEAAWRTVYWPSKRCFSHTF